MFALYSPNENIDRVSVVFTKASETNSGQVMPHAMIELWGPDPFGGPRPADMVFLGNVGGILKFSSDLKPYLDRDEINYPGSTVFGEYSWEEWEAMGQPNSRRYPTDTMLAGASCVIGFTFGLVFVEYTSTGRGLVSPSELPFIIRRTQPRRFVSVLPALAGLGVLAMLAASSNAASIVGRRRRKF